MRGAQKHERQELLEAATRDGHSRHERHTTTALVRRVEWIENTEKADECNKCSAHEQREVELAGREWTR